MSPRQSEHDSTARTDDAPDGLVRKGTVDHRLNLPQRGSASEAFRIASRRRSFGLAESGMACLSA